ncbi:MAG: hypothetical protein ACM3QS_11975 [Bacteroidota bacterium]
MKFSLRNWGVRLLALLALIVAFILLGRLISYSWMVITAVASSAVWMMIWLWPERVPARAEGRQPQSHRRLLAENDSYAGRR